MKAAGYPITLFPISSSPGRKLHRAHNLLRQGLTQGFHAAGHEITTEQWALLSHLWEEDGLSQLELGDRLEKDRPTLSRMVDLLEEGGYVTRRPSPADRRVRRVELTTQGRRAQAPLTRVATRFLQGVFEGLPGSAVAAFVRTLDHVIARLESPAPSPAPAHRRARREEV